MYIEEVVSKITSNAEEVIHGNIMMIKILLTFSR